MTFSLSGKEELVTRRESQNLSPEVLSLGSEARSCTSLKCDHLGFHAGPGHPVSCFGQAFLSSALLYHTHTLTLVLPVPQPPAQASFYPSPTLTFEPRGRASAIWFGLAAAKAKSSQLSEFSVLSGLYTRRKQVSLCVSFESLMAQRADEAKMNQVHVLPSLGPKLCQCGTCRLSSGQEVALP